MGGLTSTGRKWPLCAGARPASLPDAEVAEGRGGEEDDMHMPIVAPVRISMTAT